MHGVVCVQESVTGQQNMDIKPLLLISIYHKCCLIQNLPQWFCVLYLWYLAPIHMSQTLQVTRQSYPNLTGASPDLPQYSFSIAINKMIKKALCYLPFSIGGNSHNTNLPVFRTLNLLAGVFNFTLFLIIWFESESFWACSSLITISNTASL